MAHAENFPTHVMRWILGELNRYPTPDRGADVRTAFEAIPEPWAAELIATFAPFFQLDEQYMKIIASVKCAGQRPTEAQYYDQLRSLASALPFAQVEEKVWAYLGARRRQDEQEEQVRAERTRQEEELRLRREEEERCAETEVRRRREDEEHRARVRVRSKLPWLLRWLW
jgi:hypothetical protein